MYILNKQSEDSQSFVAESLYFDFNDLCNIAQLVFTEKIIYFFYDKMKFYFMNLIDCHFDQRIVSCLLLSNARWLT